MEPRSPLKAAAYQLYATLSGRGEDSSPRGGRWGFFKLELSIQQLVLFGLLPLSLGFCLFQSHLTAKAIRALNDGGLASSPFGMYHMNDTLIASLALANPSSARRELGYVEVTIPDQVVNFLNEAEKELQELSEPENDALLSAPAGGDQTRLPIVEAERHPVRLTPLNGLGPIATGPMPRRPKYTKEEAFTLTWDYDMDEKLPPYVGNKEFMDQFPKNSRHYYNSLAVFPFYNNDPKDFPRRHGHVGVYPNGTQLWNPSPMPPADVNDYPGGRKEGMKHGGFYLDLSNALPLDRKPADTRDAVCFDRQWNYTALDEASIIITFYNEPLSTLLRSVHSVLNQTPPPILREIILVDDHSNLTENLPGSELYEHLKLLPKVKLLRLPERRGLVWARLAGAQAAKAPVLVVLDSHIEVNEGWLEPQLWELSVEPKAIVYPQVLALSADKFEYIRNAGIGCWLSWKWNMVERASLTGEVKDPSPIPSASMAGGLFAVKADWFWEIGGYDEEFAMWGSENVEMGFRTWMCGGRLECMPCSRTYHIYRDGGVGYSSPSEAVWRNKLRTARLWMDEWYQIAAKFIGRPISDIGDIDHVLELKKRLNCKPFSWFLKNVDPTHEVQTFDDVQIFGSITNVKFSTMCVDSLGHYKDGETYGVFHCHGTGGSQGFFKVKSNKQIKTFVDETKCLSNMDGTPVFQACWDTKKVEHWDYDPDTKQLFFMKGTDKESCLAIEEKDGTNKVLVFQKCDSSDEAQQWTVEEFVPDPNFALPDFSPQYKKLHGLEDYS